MAEDWKPGDLAVCVDRSNIACSQFVHVGRNCRAVSGVSKVTGVAVKSCGCIQLRFAKGSGLAQRFRKVRPDQHEPCEAEFVELLNRSKKQVRA